MADNTTKYGNQRRKVPAPTVSLVAVRNALGLKQIDVCNEVSRLLGKSFTAGALSAIENGHRGASTETIEALEVALGLRAGDIETAYEPSHSRRKVDDEKVPA